MSLLSIEFAAFFMLLFPAYWALRPWPGAQNALLLAASLFMLWLANPYFAAALLVSPPMGGRERADVRVLHDPLIVGACRRSGPPDQPCQCTRWICSVLQASCSFFTPSMKWAVLLWASTAA